MAMGARISQTKLVSSSTMLVSWAVLCALNLVRAAEDGLARTPQMGWNSWNRFACDISEDLIFSAAKAVVSSGLKDVGYHYIVSDDCWQATSRESGTNKLLANPVRFPNGIKHLSDNIHGLGLKFGIYSSAGTYTCARQLGSLDYEQVDAQTFAEWGVDYLKYDNCYNEGRAGTPSISFERYANMSRALNATGRPILYAMCNWGDDRPWDWATEIAHSWRISGDIEDTFSGYDDRCPCTSMLDCKLPGYHCAASRILDFAGPLSQKAGPGHWNDLDTLEVGNGGMTYNEYVAHFSTWAALKSPLILGNDLAEMTSETFEIITNQAVIAVSQDPLGIPVARIWKRAVKDGDIQLWVGNLQNSAVAIVLVNTSPKSHKTDLSCSDLFSVFPAAACKVSYRLFDLWAQKTKEPPAWSEVSSRFPSFTSSAESGNSTLRHLLARSTNWGKDLGVHSGGIKGANVPARGVKFWRAELVTPSATPSATHSSVASTTPVATSSAVARHASSSQSISATSAAVTSRAF